jgi:hypothetical protein
LRKDWPSANRAGQQAPSSEGGLSALQHLGLEAETGGFST